MIPKTFIQFTVRNKNGMLLLMYFQEDVLGINSVIEKRDLIELNKHICIVLNFLLFS